MARQTGRSAPLSAVREAEASFPRPDPASCLHGHASGF